MAMNAPRLSRFFFSFFVTPLFGIFRFSFSVCVKGFPYHLPGFGLLIAIRPTFTLFFSFFLTPPSVFRFSFSICVGFYSSVYAHFHPVFSFYLTPLFPFPFSCFRFSFFVCRLCGRGLKGFLGYDARGCEQERAHERLQGGKDGVREGGGDWHACLCWALPGVF